MMKKTLSEAMNIMKEITKREIMIIKIVILILN